MPRTAKETITVVKTYLDSSLNEQKIEKVINRPVLKDPSAIQSRFEKFSLDAVNAGLAAAAKYDAFEKLEVPADAVTLNSIYSVFKGSIKIMQTTGMDIKAARKNILDKFKTIPSFREVYQTMKDLVPATQEDEESDEAGA